MNNRKITAKKLVCLLLCAVFALSSVSILASCGGKGDDTVGETRAEGTDTVAPDLPEVTTAAFDGYEFNVLISSRSTRTPNDFEAKNTESAFGTAVYTRKLRMLEKYGVNIVYEADLRSDHAAQQKMETQYSAQSNDYDLGVINTYAVAPITTSGFLYDLNTVPYLDLSKSWWDATVVRDLTISDSIYYVCGDIITTVDDYMYATIFNKEMYKQYVKDDTDVYQLVNDGKWTLDQLLRLSKLVSEDLNGDDKLDGNDKFGLMTWYDELYASVQASGGRIAKVNEDGYIELTIQNERNFEVMRKYMELENSPSTINFQNTEKLAGNPWPSIFTDGKAMFFMTIFNEISRFRDMETDYGILPNPKFNEEQEGWFCTFSAGLASFMAIPGYQENIERTGIIVELLGYEAVDTIKPGYYEKTLNGQYVKDEESIDSLTIILDNKWVDVGHYYRIGGLNTALYRVAKSGNAGSFASEYESLREQAMNQINEINKGFDELKKR